LDCHVSFVFSSGLTLLQGQAHAFPWYAQGDNIRGAELMAPEERKAYVTRLQSMKTFDECKAYMQDHYLEIDKRAKARNTLCCRRSRVTPAK
jgi:hypothetical protein